MTDNELTEIVEGRSCFCGNPYRFEEEARAGICAVCILDSERSAKAIVTLCRELKKARTALIEDLQILRKDMEAQLLAARKELHDKVIYYTAENAKLANRLRDVE